MLGALIVVLAAVIGDVDRVVLIRNDSSTVSCAVADDYAHKRGVHNIVSVRCRDSAEEPTNETIPYADYLEGIEGPLRAFLASHPQIDFIVLTKGVPIRIEGAPGIGVGNVRPSLDSYLAALDYDKDPRAIRVTFPAADFVGTAWQNRFWNSNLPFSHAEFGGYLVTRLDGFSEADARAMIDRALAAERRPHKGRVLLDTNPAYDHGGWMEFKRRHEARCGESVQPTRVRRAGREAQVCGQEVRSHRLRVLGKQ